MSPLHFIEPTTKREKGDTNEGLSSFENRYSVNCPTDLSEGVVWRRSMRHIKGARREIWCVRLKSDDGNICDG
jgi:hypothetical protein